MKISISNLSDAICASDLHSVLEEFGPIISLEMQRGTLGAVFAVVEMAESQDALAIVEFLDGDTIKGQALHIQVVECWPPTRETLQS